MNFIETHDQAVQRLQTELDPDLLVDAVRSLHPADIAAAMEQLHPDRRLLVFACLDAATAAEVLDEATPELRQRLLSALPIQRTSEIVEEMPADEAADLLNELPDTDATAILGLMEAEDAEDVRPLLDYEGDTAGGQMTTEFVAVAEGLTVEETIARLRELAPEAETVYYLYVVDADDRLVGVVSLRTLIISSPDRHVAEIMCRDVISVSADTDQEDAAEVIARYNLVAVPVVDEDGRPIGIITVDDVVDVLDEEAEEDIYEAGGAAEEGEAEVGARALLLRRLPRLAAAFGQAVAAAAGFWLLLKGGAQASAGLGVQEHGAPSVPLVAAFLPVMLALSWLIESQGRAALAFYLGAGWERRESLWLRLTGDRSTTVFLAVLILVSAGAFVSAGHYGSAVQPLTAISAGLAVGLIVSSAGAYLLPRMLYSRQPERERTPWALAAAAHAVGVLAYLGVAVRISQA